MVAVSIKEKDMYEKKPLHTDNLNINEVWGYLKGVESELERLEKILKLAGLCCFCILLGIYIAER
jgi:hypothetical protein